MVEQQMGKQRDGVRKSYSWGDVRLSVQVMICLVSTILILMFNALFQFGNAHADSNFIFILFANCLTGLGFLFVHRLTKSIWVSAAGGFCLGLICVALWVATSGLSFQLIVCLILLMALMYRIYTLMSTEWIVRQHMTAWRLDMVLGLLILFLSGLVRLSIVHVTQAVGPIIFVCATFIVFGRSWIAWELERLDSRNPRSNGFILLLSLVLVAAISALIAPRIASRLFDGLFAVLIWVAQKTSWLIVDLINWLQSMRKRSTLKPPQNQPTPKRTLITAHMHSPLLESHHAQNLLTIISICVIVMCIAGFVVYLSIKGKRAHQRPDSGLEPTTERSWIRKKSLLSFVPTSDRQRLRYQAWLRKQYDQAQIILPAETPRQFAARVADEAVVLDDQTTTKDVLTKQYEQARYGQNHRVTSEQRSTPEKDI